MNYLVKICKKHGQLKLSDITLNRISPKGKKYLRCKICRREQANNRLHIKYITTPKKHEKNKLPDFIKKEDKGHAYTILHRFKMYPEQYYSLLKKQNNVCSICHKPETQIKKKSNKLKMLSVDHCHKTQKIRGLLCFKCNIGIGSFEDSIENLKAAIDYLQKSIC